MEKKFILTETKEPITIGDVLVLSSKEENEYGTFEETQKFTITKENLPLLIKDGIISEVKPQVVNKKRLPSTLEEYIQALADKYGWSYEKMDSYLAKLDDLYPAAAFSLLLKAVAKRLDKKYEGHISTAPEIWVISTINGKVCQLNKKDVINYDNFAAFRSKEDALFATKVLRPCIIKLFGYDKQKDC